MKREDLLEALEDIGHEVNHGAAYIVLKSIIELHEPEYGDFPDEESICSSCSKNRTYVIPYPCETIQAIAKELR